MSANASAESEPICRWFHCPEHHCGKYNKVKMLSSQTQASNYLQGSVMMPKIQVSCLASELTGVNDGLLFIIHWSEWWLFLFFYKENLSLDASCFSSPPVNFLQELPSYRSIARRRTTVHSRDKQSGTLLKSTDSYSSQLEDRIAENLSSQSLRNYALNISEKRRLRFVH